MIILVLLLFGIRWIVAVTPSGVEIAISEVQVVIDDGPDPLAIPVKHKAIDTTYLVSSDTDLVHQVWVAADGCNSSNT